MTVDPSNKLDPQQQDLFIHAIRSTNDPTQPKESWSLKKAFGALIATVKTWWNFKNVKEGDVFSKAKTLHQHFDSNTILSLSSAQIQALNSAYRTGINKSLVFGEGFQKEVLQAIKKSKNQEQQRALIGFLDSKDLQSNTEQFFTGLNNKLRSSNSAQKNDGMKQVEKFLDKFAKLNETDKKTYIDNHFNDMKDFLEIFLDFRFNEDHTAKFIHAIIKHASPESIQSLPDSFIETIFTHAIQKPFAEEGRFARFQGPPSDHIWIWPETQNKIVSSFIDAHDKTNGSEKQEIAKRFYSLLPAPKMDSAAVLVQYLTGKTWEKNPADRLFDSVKELLQSEIREQVHSYQSANTTQKEAIANSLLTGLLHDVMSDTHVAEIDRLFDPLLKEEGTQGPARQLLAEVQKQLASKKRLPF